jgi:hypothetical protein
MVLPLGICFFERRLQVYHNIGVRWMYPSGNCWLIWRRSALMSV